LLVLECSIESIITDDKESQDSGKTDEEENSEPIRLELKDGQVDVFDFKVGWKIEAVCSFEVPDEGNTVEYFDCDVVPLGDIEINMRLDGIVYKTDHDLGFYVIESDTNYYRIELVDTENRSDFEVGKLISVEGKSVINRPYLVYDATFEVVEEKVTTRVLDNCLVPPQGWHDRLFRIKSNNEFWQVNFEDGQPNQHLKSHMIFCVKGVKDNHLEQTLHNCVLLDYLTDQSIAGTITEILPGHGILSIKDTRDRVIRINSEMPYEELLKFKVGDNVKVIGYKQDMRYELPVLFSQMDWVDGSRLQPVNFVGEVISTDGYKRDKQILVRSGVNVWTIDVTGEFDCYSIRPEDWVRIEGQIESYLNHTIKATSVEKTKAELFAEIIDSKYSENEIKVRELQNRANWLILPKRGRRANYGNDTKVRIVATTHEYRDFYLEDAVVTKLSEDAGMVIFVDSINQSLTLKRDNGSEFTVEIRTDWNNINEFTIGVEIEVAGLRTKDGYKSVFITRIN